MEELAFKMLASADAEIMKYLKTMCEEPIKIVAGGLALLAFLHKCYTAPPIGSASPCSSAQPITKPIKRKVLVKEVLG